MYFVLVYKPHFHPFILNIFTPTNNSFNQYTLIPASFLPTYLRMNVGGGDWMCAACQHINFKKRESCQRCTCPKYASAAEVSAYGGGTTHKTEVLAGDWYCTAMNCGSHNYASRSTCYRCGNYAMPSPAYDSSAPGWKTGDWICNRFGCGMHNYASRAECYKCKTPRDAQLYENISYS